MILNHHHNGLVLTGHLSTLQNVHDEASHAMNETVGVSQNNCVGTIMISFGVVSGRNV
ncbi:hypothetical protein SAMN05443247_08463 [Bradyrhizobium erythrophlei]|nr:hypothetical protein SAMN05443247_08463 [Bradyrhizobium erythrophlei]